MAKHSRTTISVPADLKARMDAVEEEINWSAVARQAFETKLAELIRRKAVTDVKTVIQRLRASKKELSDMKYATGFEAGKAWAMTRASVDEFERLKRYKGGFERSSWGWEGSFDLPKDVSDYSPAESVAFAIGGENYNGDRTYAADFWNTIDLDMNEPAVIRGFADGALEIWDQVKDEL
jgi:hypothetical protein